MEITKCATCRNLPPNDATRVKINPTGHHVLISGGISGCSLYMRSGNFWPNCQDKYMSVGLWQTVDVICCDCKQGEKWWSQCSHEFWQQKYTQSFLLCSHVNELVKKNVIMFDTWRMDSSFGVGEICPIVNLAALALSLQENCTG